MEIKFSVIRIYYLASFNDLKVGFRLTILLFIFKFNGNICEITFKK